MDLAISQVMVQRLVIWQMVYIYIHNLQCKPNMNGLIWTSAVAWFPSPQLVHSPTPTGNYKSWTLDYIDPDLDQFWTDALLTLPICQSEIVVKVPQALTKSS